MNEMRRIALTVSVLAVMTGRAASQWISGDTADPGKPAPMLERRVTLDKVPNSAVLTIAVAGWAEVYVNGSKVGSDVLSPVTCQPEKRISALAFDISDRLRQGENVIAVLLGNGWFNAFTKSDWRFDEAAWVAAPKVRGELVVDGRMICVTDSSWRAYDSPIVFNGLRNGEWYDARLEGSRNNERTATVEKYAPWGCVSPEDSVPCRAFETFEPVRVLESPDGAQVYDFGANISGWCEIVVSGESGAKVMLDYDESITPTNTLLGQIAAYLHTRGEEHPVQHDEYTLAGRPEGEAWHPRFTYHGFRYAKVTTLGNVQVRSIVSRFVRSAFQKVGRLETSDPVFTQLQAATMRSYLSNFVGIPTDCPHREKNGWTGDAQLAMETGLWNFDGRKGYVHFLRMMLDAQLPNGAVPCILPCSPKFGYFWGSGPAWDAALFEIPWQLYRFYGDDTPAREAYGAMKRYLSFIETKEDESGLTEYGLGDWCPPVQEKIVSVKLTDSAYVYQFNRRLAFWAKHFNEPELAIACTEKAMRIAESFGKAFYRGNGIYANGEPTALAAPLYFRGLCVPGEEPRVLARLVEAVRANEHKADFGILGAKWVPRVLAKNGYADDAWRLFTQTKQPGWAHWLSSGDGTLQERWDGSFSHNHIMFGDLSAWAYEYAAGIVPVSPGFRKVAFRPHFLKGVNSFSAVHKTPLGDIRVSWRVIDGKPVAEQSVPPGMEVVRLPLQDLPLDW